MVINGKEVRISLAAARVNAKMTQDDLARALHVSKTTISNWENEDLHNSQPNTDQLRKISELSGIPMDLIFLT